MEIIRRSCFPPCPECGGDLDFIHYTTYPPIPAYRCRKCGREWQGKPNFTVIRVPSQPQESEGKKMKIKPKKMIGYGIIALVFLTFFAIVAFERGFWTAFAAFGIAGVIAWLLIVAVGFIIDADVEDHNDDHHEL